MRQIRRNIFETNSSSTHSLTICKREDYEKWKTDGTYMYKDDDGVHFISRDEAIERYNLYCPVTRNYLGLGLDPIDTDYMTDEEIDKMLSLMRMFSYESWEKKYDRDFETYAERVDVDSAGSYFVFGYYGHS